MSPVGAGRRVRLSVQFPFVLCDTPISENSVVTHEHAKVKIFAEFNKTPRLSLLFYRNGFKIFIHINDITEKLL